MNRNFKLNTFLLVLGILPFLTSCATIVHGTRQPVTIASDPCHAAVWIDRVLVGNTPLIVSLTRKDNHFLRMELDGYHPFEITLSRTMSGWVFGNIIFGGVVGLAVDAISGGIYKLTPEQINLEMLKQEFVYSGNSKESYFAIVLQPDPSWEKIGNLVATN